MSVTDLQAETAVVHANDDAIDEAGADGVAEVLDRHAAPDRQWHRLHPSELGYEP